MPLRTVFTVVRHKSKFRVFLRLDFTGFIGGFPAMVPDFSYTSPIKLVNSHFKYHQMKTKNDAIVMPNAVHAVFSFLDMGFLSIFWTFGESAQPQQAKQHVQSEQCPCSHISALHREHHALDSIFPTMPSHRFPPSCPATVLFNRVEITPIMHDFFA